MRNTLITAGTIAALGLAATASAEDSKLSYSYVDIGYAYSTFSDYFEAFGDTDIEGGGVTFEGSLAFTDHLHMFLTYSNQDLNLPADLEVMSLGAGWSQSLTPKTDFFVRMAYLSAKPEFEGNAYDDEDGIALETGFRGMLMPKWEGEFSIKYADAARYIDDTSFHLGSHYFVTDMFGINAGVDVSNEAVTYAAGLRINFGS